MNIFLTWYPGDNVSFVALLVLVQVTLLSLVALAIVKYLGTHRPAARHAVCRAALIILLLTPVQILVVQHAGVGLLHGSWSLSVPFAIDTLMSANLDNAHGGDLMTEEKQSGVSPESVTVVSLGARRQGLPASMPALLPQPEYQVSYKPVDWLRAGLTVFLVVWIVGMLYRFVRLVWGCLSQCIMVRSGQEWDIRSYRQLLDQVRIHLGFRKLPQIALSRTVAGPVVCGFLRPTVLLPYDLPSLLQPNQLQQVLIHECAHIRQHDQWVGLLQRFADTMFWLNPLMGWLNRELARAREEICDNYVLRRGEAAEYAQTLLDLARTLPSFGRLPAELGLVGSKWNLEERVEELFSERRSFVTTLNKWSIMGFVCSFFFAGLGIAFCQPTEVSEKALPSKPVQGAAVSSGGSVLLSLDSRIQSLAEECLRDTIGAVVVLNPNNGDVLAMASSPSVNSNGIGSVVSRTLWDGLNANAAGSMFNKAVAEVYAAGNVFNPISALAALQSGLAGTGLVVNCTGSYQFGNRKLHCWKSEGHGQVDLRRAIEQSCNVYFAAIGEKCGNNAIADMAVQFGLGAKSGIALEREASGLVPTPEWKKQVLGTEWQLGDTCNFSIGQGALSVTPLQMAVVSAALANGGTVWRPRLVRGLRDEQGNTLTNYPAVSIRHLTADPAAIQSVREGMRDAITSPSGTGKRVQIPGVEMAGKTGVGIYGGSDGHKKSGWMILFAPYDKPQYAVAMVVDDVESSGLLTAGARLCQLMMGIFDKSMGK